MLQAKSVLIVDDSHIIQQTTKAVLHKCGFPSANLYSASNATDALQACRDKAFDILLLDFNLGNGRSGLQLLEQLHHLELLEHNPLVLIITADDSLPIVMAFAEYEPDDYLVKPLRADSLQKRLAVNFSQQQLNETVWKAFQDSGVAGARWALQQAKSEKSFRLTITQLCKRLAKHNNVDTAIALLKSFTRQHDYLPAKLLLVELLLKNGLHEQAAMTNKALHAAFPKHINVLDLAARIHMKNKDFKQGYQLWIQAYQLSHYNLERLLGLVLIEQTLLSERGNIDKLLRDANNLLHGSIWDSQNMRCLIAWGLMQQMPKAPQSLERLWCSVSREETVTSADRPYLHLLSAWQKAEQGQKLLAFKQLTNIPSTRETKDSYVFQLILYRLYLSLGMQPAMKKALAQIALLCTQDSCESHRVIKYQWLQKATPAQSVDANYEQALALFHQSPELAADAIFAAWENNRFDSELARCLITLCCNNHVELNHDKRESFIQARWVFESRQEQPEWYLRLQQANSTLQTPVEIMTSKASRRTTA
ncbi:response regulator [Photobacterium alginatilyticum]|uniref:response regulator n=1 Tax=Photobacterium alginatilyticum TaxID=1775171 RepID=UPI004067B8F6